MMTIKLAVVSCMLALAVVSAEADKLNCAGIQVESLVQIKKGDHPCEKIMSLMAPEKVVDRYKKYQLTRECHCSLMQQQTLWDSLADANVQYVFGEVMRLLNVQGDEEKVLISLDERQLAEGTFSKKITGDRNKVTKACDRMYDEFGLFYEYLYFSSVVSGNPDMIYKLATYDQSFFKCMVAWRSCKPRY